VVGVTLDREMGEMESAKSATSFTGDGSVCTNDGDCMVPILHTLTLTPGKMSSLLRRVSALQLFLRS
jgi:hypothetical protein